MIILNKFDVISNFFVTLSSLVDKEWTIETIRTDSETIRDDWSRQRWFNDRFAAPRS